MKENEDIEVCIENGLQYLQRLVTAYRKGQTLKLSALKDVGDLSGGQVLQIVQQQYCQNGLQHQLIAEGLTQAGIILIITDGHFDLPIFTCYFINFIKTRKPDEEDQIKKYLSRLHVYHVFDSEHFELVCMKLGEILRNNLDVFLIIVDTLSAFYWSDIIDTQTKVKMDSYLKKMLRMVQLAVREYCLAIIYMRPDYFKSKNSCSNMDQCVETPTLEKINYNILMKEKDERDCNNEMFVISVSNYSNTVFKNYCFDNGDIHWF